MYGMHLKKGDRVDTPEGSGRVVGFLSGGLICAVEHDVENKDFFTFIGLENKGISPLNKQSGMFHKPQNCRKIKN